MSPAAPQRRESPPELPVDIAPVFEIQSAPEGQSIIKVTSITKGQQKPEKDVRYSDILPASFNILDKGQPDDIVPYVAQYRGVWFMLAPAEKGLSSVSIPTNRRVQIADFLKEKLKLEEKGKGQRKSTSPQKGIRPTSLVTVLSKINSTTEPSMSRPRNDPLLAEVSFASEMPGTGGWEFWIKYQHGRSNEAGKTESYVQIDKFAESHQNLIRAYGNAVLHLEVVRYGTQWYLSGPAIDHLKLQIHRQYTIDGIKGTRISDQDCKDYIKKAEEDLPVQVKNIEQHAKQFQDECLTREQSLAGHLGKGKGRAILHT